MTKQWYQEKGYKMSSLIEQAEIDRAERDVTAAYVAPIVGGMTEHEMERQNAVAELAFLLLLQRSIFATRAGAKAKMGYNSNDAGEWQLLAQCAHSAHIAIERLRSLQGANASAEITDICKIYFKSNFISL